ncbi:MAG: ATPase, partial [Bacteroidia bacterium]
DHCIGHAYFINVRTLQDLQGAFQHSILPLLQEYFYGDYGKIGLVLGKGFVSAANADRENADEFFAEFHNPHRHDLVRREVWHLEDVGNMSEEAFLAALKSMNIKPLPQV